MGTFCLRGESNFLRKNQDSWGSHIAPIARMRSELESNRFGSDDLHACKRD